jgi:hypothetical protein
MSQALRYAPRSSSVIFSSSVWIYWAMLSFGPGGAVGVVVTVATLVVAIVGVEGVGEGVKEVGVMMASFIQTFALF